MSSKARDTARNARRNPGTDGHLIDWRRAQLMRAGFEDDLATRAAADRAMDVHALLDLVDAGCPPDLAVRILAPLGEPNNSC
jgi:hypothetical protein